MKPFQPNDDLSPTDHRTLKNESSDASASSNTSSVGSVSDETSLSDSPESFAIGEIQGIERNRDLFAPGDPMEIVNFSPSEDPLPTPVGVPSADTEDEVLLSFDDLSAIEVKEEKGPRIIRRRIVKQEKGGAIRRLSFAIVYMITVLCLGFLAAMMIISVGNDVFAFVKDESLYEITIDDPNMSLHDLSEYLAEEGIIEHPFIFRLYVGMKTDGENPELQAGTYMISPSFNYDKILLSLNPAPVQEEVTITFSEGLTIDDIIDIFVEKGIGTRKGFEDAIENGEFDYWFLKDLEPNEDRYYRLEGYLYPDTYRFYTNSSEEAALKKMLNNFEKKVPKSYKDECDALGITLDQAVILASLIEAECTWVTDFELVSGVFHNRMKAASFNGRLDSDATIQYVLRHTTGARKEELTEEDLQIDSPYNSRMYGGYPPGPICNPSLNALTAAIYPNTSAGYYYFVAQANGYNLYAKTYNEHLKNVETVRKESEE